MNDTAPDERPLKQPDPAIEKIMDLVQEYGNRRRDYVTTNIASEPVEEAFQAVRDALADAGPKWQTTDTLPPAAIAKDYDRIKRYSADCWVYDGAEVQPAVYSYKTSKWMDASGDRINGVTHWQYVTVPPAPEETP